MKKKLVEFNLAQRSKKMPDLQGGDVVKVYRLIKEGEKERTQVFEGIVIAVKGRQSSSPTITVRKVSFGVGVELILPMYSPQIEKIELVKRAKVRRAKLYYIRGKSAKSMRMKYKDISEFVKKEEESVVEKKEVSAGEEIVSTDKVQEAKKPEAEIKKEKKVVSITKPKEEKSAEKGAEKKPEAKKKE